MKKGDAELNYAYFALFKLNIKPKEFTLMDIREKALIIAFIDKFIDEQKELE
ncbi:hypothetical protein [[Clostridium] colinum]|uniref:hypothetical protein n=1 Tax=[Clostridium] colinum TaxID=36835 RepID=UPI002025A63B|nr:hypothetical protein [[Clostridium] colinum]